ncbi:hypothetical protein T03_8475 [Trichinella britovi]|uniref:Uncharacterized protein n=1 Tax=Trichinella britovi TaxID=45882 RepID=A0A0V1D0H6_TRIBR|nr:hypothetical protein T03_8475 [Trichinella britovi]KRZ90599.1 hypothetical protein T08_14762 [Trichinella sp. T8]
MLESIILEQQVHGTHASVSVRPLVQFLFIHLSTTNASTTRTCSLFANKLAGWLVIKVGVACSKNLFHL